MTQPGENSLTDIRKWFGTPDREVLMAEFRDFWKELSEEDKKYCKTMPLG